MEQQIVLRPVTDRDMALIRGWLLQDHVVKWFEHPQDWLNEIENRKNQFAWINHFIVSFEGADIGFCQYYAYKNSGEDWHGSVDVEGSYSLDYLIGDMAYMGRGLGKKIICVLVQEIGKAPDAKRVLAKPDTQNAASCNTLLSAGFRYDAKNELYLYSYN